MEPNNLRHVVGSRESPPPFTPPHKGEGGVDVAESPSPLWGGVKGGGDQAAKSHARPIEQATLP